MAGSFIDGRWVGPLEAQRIAAEKARLSTYRAKMQSSWDKRTPGSKPKMLFGNVAIPNVQTSEERKVDGWQVDNTPQTAAPIVMPPGLEQTKPLAVSTPAPVIAPKPDITPKSSDTNPIENSLTKEELDTLKKILAKYKNPAKASPVLNKLLTFV
jgi:hypothetical protein